MLIARLVAIPTVAAVLVTVTACGSSSGGSSKTGSTSSSSSSIASATPTATAPTSVVGSSSSSASDDSTSDTPSFVKGGAALANAGTLVSVLEAVDPKIGTSKDDLVAKSKALCDHVNANEPESQLETAAATGFTNGSWVPSDAEAQAIVGTVEAYAGC